MTGHMQMSTPLQRVLRGRTLWPTTSLPTLTIPRSTSGKLLAWCGNHWHHWREESIMHLPMQTIEGWLTILWENACVRHPRATSKRVKQLCSVLPKPVLISTYTLTPRQHTDCCVWIASLIPAFWCCNAHLVLVCHITTCADTGLTTGMQKFCHVTLSLAG